MEDKLLFILFYCKVYPLQEVMAFLFETSQGRDNAWIHTLSTVLQMALGEAKALPARDPKNLELNRRWPSVGRLLSSWLARHGAPIVRKIKPSKKNRTAGKTTHTVQNNRIVDLAERLVRYRSQTSAGRTHDKRIGDEED